MPNSPLTTFTAGVRARGAEVTAALAKFYSTSYDAKHGTIFLEASTKTDTDYTVLDTDGIHTILVSTGNTNRTITLPTAADNSGRILHIIKSDSGTGSVTVDGEGSETISGETTITLTSQYECLSIHCNGTAWFRLNSASGGSGSGEKNYVTAPSTASGWATVGDLDVATSTTASELPREHTTGTGIKITADANTQSTADYVYCDFTLDDVDLNKKLKIQWSQKTTGTYTAGDLAVIITTQADRTTAVATPQTTAIPAADGVFTTSFDSSSTATLSLVIRATGDMSTDGGIVISDVVVGPGTIVPAEASFASRLTTGASERPSFTNMAGTISTTSSHVSRRDQNVKIRQLFSCTGATTGTITIVPPTDFPVDTTAISPGQVVGWVRSFDDSASVEYHSNIIYISASAFRIAGPSGQANWNATVPFTWANLDRMDICLDYPVSTWAGSPNYAGQNDVDYAYTSGTWDADDSTTAFGQNGGSIGGALTTSRAKTITWPSPSQKGDSFQFWLDLNNSGIWVPAVGAHNPAVVDLAVPALTNASTGATETVGVGISHPSLTTTRVQFGRYAAGELDSGNLQAWNTIAPSGRWLVTRARAGAAVGFGIASGGNSGLISAYQEGTWTPAHSSSNNITNGASATFSGAKYTRIGRMVFASIKLISGQSFTSGGGTATYTWWQLTSTGLPSVTNATSFRGGGHCATAGNDFVPMAITDASGSNSTIFLQFDLIGAGIASSEAFACNDVHFWYLTDE